MILKSIKLPVGALILSIASIQLVAAVELQEPIPGSDASAFGAKLPLPPLKPGHAFLNGFSRSRLPVSLVEKQSPFIANTGITQEIKRFEILEHSQSRSLDLE